MDKSHSQHALARTSGMLTCAVLVVLLAVTVSTGCTATTPQNEGSSQQTAQTSGATSSEAAPSSDSGLITTLTPDEGLSYSLFFGLIDKETGKQEHSTAEYREAIAALFTEAGVGYTVYEAYGAYPLEDGTVVENVTLVFTGIHSTEEALQALIDKVQTELNLESVYCESYLHGYGISGGVVHALE